MRQPFLTLIFAFALGLSSAKTCSCIGPQKVKKAMKQAAAVFSGTVENIEEIAFPLDAEFGPSEDSVHKLRVTIVVDQGVKGTQHGERLVVMTGIGGGDCGFPFVVGKQYVVYGFWWNRRINDESKMMRCLSTNICTRSTSAVEEEMRAIKEAKLFRGKS